jgi:translation initiation factor 1
MEITERRTEGRPINPLFESTRKNMKLQKTLHSLEDLEQLSDHKPVSTVSVVRQHDGKGKSVRVMLDTHGRKGKSVTVVVGLQHNPTTLEEIARILKQHCGAGGTVKEGAIEIQGDRRVRVTSKLKEMNYSVK